MKNFILLTLAVGGAVAFLTVAGAVDQAPSKPATSAPSQAESVTLADACRLTQLVNDNKWDDLERALGAKEWMIAILRQHAALKDWSGIGAYRGTRVDEKSPLRVTHRFGLGPRSNPHEIWFSYTIAETGTSKPSLMVMGW